MKRIVTVVLLLLWIMLGLAWYSHYHRKIQYPAALALQEQVYNFSVRSKNPGDFLDLLPLVFQKNPATSALFVYNEKSQLMGSMFEADRMSREVYRGHLENQNSILNNKNNKSIVMVKASEKWRVYIVINSSIPLNTILRNLVAENKETKWAIIFFFFVIFIFAILLATVRGSNAESSTFEDPPDFKPGMDVSLTHHHPISENVKTIYTEKKPPFPEEAINEEEPSTMVQPEKEALFPSGPFFSKKILSLMDSLEKQYSCKTVSYHSWDTRQLTPVIQKMGGITIQGESMAKLPPTLAKLEINNNPPIVQSEDFKNVYIPMVYRNTLIGLLHMQFERIAKLTLEEKVNIREVCSLFSQSIFLQRIYDAATTDPDTDFYTYPYFYFYLKEKLKQSNAFSVFIFEVPQIDNATPNSARVFSKNLRFTLDSQNLPADIMVRMDRNKFALVFDMVFDPSDDTNMGMSDMEKVPGVVQVAVSSAFTSSSINQKVKGGFFIRPKHMDDADSFMKRLEYVLIGSRLNPDGIQTLNARYDNMLSENSQLRFR